MGDVIHFQLRARPPADRLAPTDQLDVRSHIEGAVQAALDTADRLIAVLDGMDGDPDREDGADAEPSLGAPEGPESQVVWLRGGDDDREGDVPAALIPDLQMALGVPLPWPGRGNVLTAIGGAVLDLAGL